MYTYGELKEYILRLRNDGVSVGSIGRSLWGNELFFAHVGPAFLPQIIITGGIHARENGGCALVARQIDRLLSVVDTLRCGFYLLPMLNPDGALLLQNGSNDERLVTLNGGNDFGLWKANANAVDLNVNFPADWGRGVNNVRSPAPSNFIGPYPLSEPETKALCEFTLKVAPVFTVSYHELGREVYWYFHQKNGDDRLVARRIADMLDYKLVDGDLGSAGGYKDWCVLNGIPAVTIEVGKEELKHPAFEEDIEEDILRNLDLAVAVGKGDIFPL